jgi:hypothetical protein
MAARDLMPLKVVIRELVSRYRHMEVRVRDDVVAFRVRLATNESIYQLKYNISHFRRHYSNVTQYMDKDGRAGVIAYSMILGANVVFVTTGSREDDNLCFTKGNVSVSIDRCHTCAMPLANLSCTRCQALYCNWKCRMRDWCTHRRRCRRTMHRVSRAIGSIDE